MTEIVREVEYADLFDNRDDACKRTLDALAPRLVREVMDAGGRAVVDIEMEKKDFPERSIIKATITPAVIQVGEPA